MKVSFEGIGEQVISFAAASGLTKGVFVKMSANGTVTACSAGDGFAGYCIESEGGFAEVKTHGYMKCPYTGTAPSVGFGILVADAGGKVKSAQSGTAYLIVEVDTTAGTVGFMM